MELITIGRWILSAGLIYGVYRETGVCTSIVMTLLFIHTEIKR